MESGNLKRGSPEERLSETSLVLQRMSDIGAEAGRKLPHSEALPVQAPGKASAWTCTLMLTQYVYLCGMWTLVLLQSDPPSCSNTMLALPGLRPPRPGYTRHLDGTLVLGSFSLVPGHTTYSLFFALDFLNVWDGSQVSPPKMGPEMTALGFNRKSVGP